MSKKPKIQKFTFKTVKEMGRYRSFYPDQHHIKLNKIDVGYIDDGIGHKIRLKVWGSPEDNPNSNWRWVKLAKEFNTVSEAKEFLNTNFDLINEKFKLYTDE